MMPPALDREVLIDQGLEVESAPGRVAIYSADGAYRYLLTVTAGESPAFPYEERAGGRVVFVMLNPSTATARVDDPTVRRCRRFAEAWGYGRLDVVNLFALRSTDPAALESHEAPSGDPQALDIIRATLEGSDAVIVAWGVWGALRGRGRTILREVIEARGAPPLCLGTTQAGHPRHPLYVRADREPEPFYTFPAHYPQRRTQ